MTYEFMSGSGECENGVCISNSLSLEYGAQFTYLQRQKMFRLFAKDSNFQPLYMNATCTFLSLVCV